MATSEIKIDLDPGQDNLGHGGNRVYGVLSSTVTEQKKNARTIDNDTSSQFIVHG